MFNTNYKTQTSYVDGYAEYEAEIERQLAALGPLSESDLLNDVGDEDVFDPSVFFSAPSQPEAPLESWNAFVNASKTRDDQLNTWNRDLKEDLGHFNLSLVHPTSTPTTSVTLDAVVPTEPQKAPLQLEDILRDLKELQQIEKQQQNNTSSAPLPPTIEYTSALDRERLQIEREIEAREKQKKELEERAQREKEAEERRREIERKRAEEEERIAEEGRKLKEKMEEVKRAREEMLRIEKEREMERIRLVKEAEEARKRKQEEDRLREEAEEIERQRVIEVERKARIERETQLREEAARQKREAERLAAFKAEQERIAKEEEDARRRIQEQKREEEDRKKRELLEQKKRELERMQQKEEKKELKRVKEEQRRENEAQMRAKEELYRAKQLSKSNTGTPRDENEEPNNAESHVDSMDKRVHNDRVRSLAKTSSTNVSGSKGSSRPSSRHKIKDGKGSRPSTIEHASRSKQSPYSQAQHHQPQPLALPQTLRQSQVQHQLQPQQSLQKSQQSQLEQTQQPQQPQLQQLQSQPPLHHAQTQRELALTTQRLEKVEQPEKLERTEQPAAKQPELEQEPEHVLLEPEHHEPPDSLTPQILRSPSQHSHHGQAMEVSVTELPAESIPSAHNTSEIWKEKPESVEPSTEIRKGVVLSKELIESLFPSIPLSNISYVDLSLESIIKVEALDLCPNLHALLLNTNYISTLEGFAPCTSLEILELKDNPLATPLVFPQLPSLMSLSLDLCQLKEIAGSTLPQNLRSISINGNQLTSLEALVNSEQLQRVIARRNRITALPTDANGPIWQHLITLDVASNSLTTLNSFTWAPMVGSIIASNNHIRSWPTDLHTPLLRELHLNGNSITTFGPVGFFPMLRFLDLCDNRVTHLEWTGGCPLLDTLLLSRNEIAAFSALRPLSALRELRVLRLDGNPVASSMLYPRSLGDLCPSLEEVDEKPFTSPEILTVLPTQTLSPEYITHWLTAQQSERPPHDKEPPKWWDYSAVLKICRDLTSEATEMAERNKLRGISFLEQKIVDAEELALSKCHLDKLTSLGLNPKAFLQEFAAPSLKHSLQEKSAVKIQAFWRGHFCRKHLGLIGAQYRIVHIRAAIHIQRVWRGHAARRISPYCARVAAKRKAAVIIQKVWRGFMVRDTLKKARQAIRATFVDLGWDLGPAPSFDVPSFDDLDLRPPEDDMFEAFLDEMDDTPMHYAPLPVPPNTTLVLVKEKPPTPVIPLLSLNNALQSQPKPQPVPAPQPLPQAGGLTGDPHMDAVAQEWNFKDPRTLEILMKREKKRSTPNRHHQQLPVRRASSHEFKLQENRFSSQKPRSALSVHPPKTHEDETCLTAKSDPSGVVLPRRGRQLAPVSAQLFSTSAHPPVAPTSSFLPDLKLTTHTTNHAKGSNSNTNTSISAKKLPPIRHKG